MPWESVWPKVRVSFSFSFQLLRTFHRQHHGTFRALVHRSPDLTGLHREVERVTRFHEMYGRQQVCWDALLSAGFCDSN